MAGLRPLGALYGGYGRRADTTPPPSYFTSSRPPTASVPHAQEPLLAFLC
jgi:hypothetical protein